MKMEGNSKNPLINGPQSTKKTKQNKTKQHLTE